MYSIHSRFHRGSVRSAPSTTGFRLSGLCARPGYVPSPAGSPDHDRGSRPLLEESGHIMQRPWGIDDSSSFTHGKEPRDAGGVLRQTADRRPDPGILDRAADRAVRDLAGQGRLRNPVRPAEGAAGDRLRRVRRGERRPSARRPAGARQRLRRHAGQPVPLRPASVYSYRFHLSRFEAWLGRTGVTGLHELSPPLLSAYTAERSAAGLAKTTVREGCGVLRVFLRYARREGVLSRDLAEAVEWPQAYRLSTLPRSISWEDVGRVLALPDRRTPCGKRDYAIMLLLATYGLRAREIVALTLDDIDWKHARLAIPERKAAHSTAFPLSGVAGDALADYLRNGRPQSGDRHVFFRAMAPVRPIGGAAVSGCARRYLLLAGVDVPRPGSHTLRHSAV